VLRQLSARHIEAQHRRHRQLHARRHLHATLGNDWFGRRSERRADAGVAIAVGETADRHLLHRRQRHDASVVPFEPRWVNRDLDPPKGCLVIAALEPHGGVVSGREGMDNADAVKVRRQPEPRIIGARRLQSLLGKEKCKAVDGGAEEIWPLMRLLRIEIGHFRQCNHFVLVAAAVGGDCVQRRDRAARIVVVALRENPAAQHVAGRWAELVGGKGICGQLMLGGAGVDALHADWRRAPGGEHEPDDAAQSEGNVSRWRALHHKETGIALCDTLAPLRMNADLERLPPAICQRLFGNGSERPADPPEGG